MTNIGSSAEKKAQSELTNGLGDNPSKNALDNNGDINDPGNDVDREVEVENEVKDTHQWQRISPIALVYFLLMFFKNIFGNIIYIAPALLVFYQKMQENPAVAYPVLYGIIALSSLFSLLSYYFFQYRLTDKKIEIRSGVFQKKYIDLPFSRIQNVELTEPFYYRPFSYACLQLDTAGTAKQEAKVVALKKSFAEKLKAEILSSHQSATKQEDEEHLQGSENARQAHISEEEITLDTRNLDDLVIHGLTNNRVWIFVAGLAPFIEPISQKVGQWLMFFNINLDQYFEFSTMSVWQIVSTFVTAFLIIMIPMAIFSILGSIISFHDFKLSRSGDKYIRRSGLFTRNEVTMRLSRLQMIVRQQDWLDVLLRRINLRFEQISSGLEHAQPGQLTNKIIVPSVTNKECQHLIDDAYPDNQLQSINFNPVSKRLLFRNLVLFLLPFIVITSSILIHTKQYEGFTGVAIICCLLSGLIFMRYKRWGYAIDENFIYVRRGCLGVDYRCFPIHKVQQTEFKQSWFLERKGLCSINFILAAGSVKIPYILTTTGYEIINRSLYEVEHSKKSWM